MSKLALKIISVLLIIMGIAAFIPTWLWSAAPAWYGIVKILLGVIGFSIAYSDKR